MCGIAGWYRRGGRPVEARLLEAQCDTILHRGPDEGGVLAEGDFGFGMRRLSILDLAGGHQPMRSADGRAAIVFNGEIYNHLELRPELERAGHRFRGSSDTETILAAWQHWGERCWARLEGMFAVAIWDRPARRLVLARDQLGIKPLFLTEQRGGLAFASEIKALLPLPEHGFTVDPRAVHDYFTAGHVRPPRSIYREVRQLPPGHALTLGPTGESSVDAFWRFPRPAPQRRTPGEWVEEFRAIWLDTVRRHMLSDVPLGSFLSGGVDSSAVTAAMARLSDRPVKAFTIGFPGSAVDETAHARRVAEHLGCERRHRVVELRDAAEILPRLVRSFDEPFADPAAIPSLYLAELAAAEVKVALAGDGGDEIFAGYRRHRTEQRIGRYRALRHAIRPLGGALGLLGEARTGQLRQKLRRLGDAAGTEGGYARFFRKTEITSPALREALMVPGFHAAQDAAPEQLRDELVDDPWHGAGALHQFLHADATLQLPGQMLCKVDRASMAHSLEVRVPFLSSRLVDWAATVPLELKLRGATGKWIIRRAVEPWLPPGVLDRPKQGFKLPLAAWFRGDFADYARAAWNDSGAAGAGFLEPASVETLFREHAAGTRDHGRILYALAVFGTWWGGRPGR
ncbi:asparagine synthase (glutamine-hydrolyzing) [Roseomonas elaeocarpi]|uniref:asparagine synthase (glutamine-hydrolyzing) n=1 Tax=Roseomonas elaeocarpi TaxID=907779 RepID=A0ABV6JXL8_9PROT